MLCCALPPLGTKGAWLPVQDTLALVEQELKEHEKTIERFELEIKRRHDEIERKTGAMDLLNKEFEKLTAANKMSSNTGPLEQTINNLQSEIDQKVSAWELVPIVIYWLLGYQLPEVDRPYWTLAASCLGS